MNILDPICPSGAMAGRSLLQVLLVAVVLGSYGTQAQGGIHYPVYGPRDSASASVVFPESNPEFLNRFILDDMPTPLQPIRARNTPNCAMVNGNALADPCVVDNDYNDNIRTLISRLLTQTSSVNEIVSDPMLRIILNDTLTAVVDPAVVPPSVRFGGARENPVCSSEEELIFPQRAKTPKDDWVFVLNQDNVKQALRVEKCTRAGKPCNFGLRSTGEITTVCRQKYVYRRMLTLGTNNIEPEEVLMPSCCVCYFRRETGDISTRINLNGTFDNEHVSTNQPSAPSAPPAPPVSAPINFGVPARTSPLRQGSSTFINTRSSSVNRNNGGFTPFYPHGIRHR